MFSFTLLAYIVFICWWSTCIRCTVIWDQSDLRYPLIWYVLLTLSPISNLLYWFYFFCTAISTIFLYCLSPVLSFPISSASNNKTRRNVSGCRVPPLLFLWLLLLSGVFPSLCYLYLWCYGVGSGLCCSFIHNFIYVP